VGDDALDGEPGMAGEQGGGVLQGLVDDVHVQPTISVEVSSGPHRPRSSEHGRSPAPAGRGTAGVWVVRCPAATLQPGMAAASGWGRSMAVSAPSCNGWRPGSGAQVPCTTTEAQGVEVAGESSGPAGRWRPAPSWRRAVSDVVARTAPPAEGADHARHRPSRRPRSPARA
jgi:hypothetical protein